MGSFINMIISAIKYRFAAITALLSTWTNKSFLKAGLLARFRQWLTSLFNIRPRDKKDYYGVFGYLVSKRLVHLVVVCIGIVCLVYLWLTKPFQTAASTSGTEKIHVYKYNSLPLKFISNKVSIKAKDGYIAYTGDVKGGYAEGTGELYDKDGDLVYVGDFSKNKYNGSGKTYYKSGQIEYDGEFKDNLFSGSGSLYRESGTLNYKGAFSGGYFEGDGELYNAAGTQIFTGTFHRGELDYVQLLNKTAGDITEIYTGTQKIYSYDDENLIALDEISALYYTKNSATSIENATKSAAIYVMDDVFVDGDKRISSIDELTEAMGEPKYEGNSYLTFYDATAIQWGLDNGMEIDIDPGLEYTEEYDEYTSVTDYDGDAMLYMYVYELDDISYTFVSEGRSGDFFMYIIEG